MTVSAKILAVALVFATTALTMPAMADDPPYLLGGVGSWEVFRNSNHAAEIDLSYRSDLSVWIIKPQFGLVTATDGDFYGFAGIYTDLALTDHLIFTPNLSAGGYGGHGIRLGSHVEFRSGADLFWRFENASRLGMGFYHLSNGGITRRNPGDESLVVQYAYPFSL
jgi:hypothetical protein